MQRKAHKLLWDIRAACDALRAFVAGKAFTDYQHDALLRSAVERQFEIIGEAMTQLLRINPELEPRITESHRIIAFRNRLIHGYSDIDHEVVWQTLDIKLPLLRQQVEALLVD